MFFNIFKKKENIKMCESIESKRDRILEKLIKR